jgi:type IV pilus assembly protein PilW
MNRKGITLIELLVALSVSGILVAGVYKTFISQQHTYTVQDQLVDMQQNVRLAINRMTRELRMAGFGGGGVDGWTSTDFFKHGAIYGSYTNVVNPGGGGTNVTILEGYEPLVRTTLSGNAVTNDKKIFLNDVSSFDAPPNPRKYISINGTEAHHITAIDTADKKITFPGWDKLVADHLAGEPVYLLGAVTYSIGMFDGKSCLLRDDHMGGGAQPVADNIESLQFRYFDANGNETANPADIRMIQVTVVAISDQTDKDYKTGGGFRRQPLTSNIQLRNLLF